MGCIREGASKGIKQNKGTEISRSRHSRCAEYIENLYHIPHIACPGTKSTHIFSDVFVIIYFLTLANLRFQEKILIYLMKITTAMKKNFLQRIRNYPKATRSKR